MILYSFETRTHIPYTRELYTLAKRFLQLISRKLYIFIFNVVTRCDFQNFHLNIPTRRRSNVSLNSNRFTFARGRCKESASCCCLLGFVIKKKKKKTILEVYLK